MPDPDDLLFTNEQKDREYDADATAWWCTWDIHESELEQVGDLIAGGPAVVGTVGLLANLGWFWELRYSEHDPRDGEVIDVQYVEDRSEAERQLRVAAAAWFAQHR